MGELLLQPILLATGEGLNRHLIALRQLQHHLGKTALLQLHQELDAVATSPTGEAVVDLLGGGHRHGRRVVLMERAETHKFPSPPLEHHVLGHHVHNVGSLLDGSDGAGMELGGHQEEGGLGDIRRLNRDPKVKHGP